MDPANSLSVTAIGRPPLTDRSAPYGRGERDGIGAVAGNKSVFRTGVAAARMIQSRHAKRLQPVLSDREGVRDPRQSVDPAHHARAHGGHGKATKNSRQRGDAI